MASPAADPSSHDINLSNIRARVWNGCLNIRIVLQQDPAKNTHRTGQTHNQVEFLLNIYRNSYLPLYIPHIIAYFQQFRRNLSASSPVWFEYEGVPLKWHLPIGVLYDFLHLPSVADDGNNNVWSIVLKYAISGDSYPKDYIIPFSYKLEDANAIDYTKSLQEVIVNQLKQSCFVLNGSSKNIMNLNQSKSSDLWNSITKHNLKMYDTVNKKVIGSKCQRIPVKILIPGTSSMIQSPIAPSRDSRPTTVRDLLQDRLPDLCSESDSGPGRVYIQGIHIKNADIALLDIWSLFKHLDNFLYIIVICKN